MKRIKKSRRKKPVWQKALACERIEILFEQAEEKFKETPKYSHSYVELARKISMRYRVRIPKKFKRLYCKHCYHYLKPGVNCTIRLNQRRFPKVVVTCNECSKIMRIPYSKEKLAKKKTK